jgi:hypothetical protein
MVYCHECWWSDKWDAIKYGQKFDFNRPFFDQFQELLQKCGRSASLLVQKEQPSKLKDGRMVMVNSANVDCIEVFSSL